MRKVCLTCKKEYSDDRASCPDDGGDLMPVITDPFVGTVVADKYELLSVIGVGGMSTIYKAKHKYMGRIVAIKLLHPYLVSDASMFQRFQYEAKAASNLNHPNVVGIHDFGITDDGKAYLVMDYLEGEDLSTILEREGLLPEVQALEIFRQTCAGLDHAHSKGVIHRDLKPSNLFLCPEEEGRFIVKLVDFGIAKITEVPGEAAQSLTRTGEVFGSPLYMSPEQCSGKPLDARSDLYSMGCVMYEVLTGRRPLAGSTAIDTMHKHLKEAPQSFKQIAPTLVVSEHVEQAVLKCLAKAPHDRFDSVAALYLDLYGEALPKWSTQVSRNSAPSVNLEVRSGSSGPSVSVKAADGDLNDLSKTAPSQVNAPVINRPAPKWHLPAGIVLLLCTVSVASLGVWAIFIWDGPTNDRGLQIDRWAYTYHLTRGDNLIRQKHYADAEVELKTAAEIAGKFGDNSGRLMNVYRSELTLYKNSNQYDKQEKVINQMIEVTRSRAHNDYATALEEINQIDSLINNKVNGLSHLGEQELELQLSALIKGIRGIARQLGAGGDYEHQESLLNSTIKTYSKLASDDDAQLGGLDLDLAESHVSQDEFDEARPLFKKSLEIYIRANAHNKGRVSDLDLAQIWLRIGQFDRDRSNFKDGGSELTTAYNMLKSYGSEKTARRDKGRGIKLLIESLNALADYSDQTTKPDDAKKYRLEARAMKEMRRKLHIDLND